jgi:predicted nucleotidyltransferase
MPQAHITIPQDKLADFCRRYRVRRLALFGSVAQRFRPDSGVMYSSCSSQRPR